jgi:hypothetical protein
LLATILAVASDTITAQVSLALPPVQFIQPVGIEPALEAAELAA